jgi:hypothetical protein
LCSFGFSFDRSAVVNIDHFTWEKQQGNSAAMEGCKAIIFERKSQSGGMASFFMNPTKRIGAPVWHKLLKHLGGPVKVDVVATIPIVARSASATPYKARTISMPTG